MVTCHLTRIFQSGGYSQFRQDVDLEQNPDADNPQHNYYVFHRLSPLMQLHNLTKFPAKADYRT